MKYELNKDYFPYDEELLQKLYTNRFCGIPYSFLLLDYRKTKSYCHNMANCLTSIIPNSKRVEGSMDIIKSEDNAHSWVELNDLVYDTTDIIIWKKDSYYEKYKPYNIKVISDEEVQEDLNQYKNYTDNMPEMYIAWIRDLEKNIDNNPYKNIILDDIKKFKEEKHLDTIKYSEDLVEEYIDDLNNLYKHIEEFTKEDDDKPQKGK